MILIIALVIVLAIVGPLAVIWSINTLFGLAIAYSFKTWLAVIILASAIRAKVEKKG